MFLVLFGTFRFLLGSEFLTEYNGAVSIEQTSPDKR